MDCNYRRCWREKKGLVVWGEEFYFKAVWNINKMRRRVMADWPFVLVLQVVLRHPVKTRVLLKNCDTQMPTLPPTWKHTCRSASSIVWQPNWFINQWNLLHFHVFWPDWKCAIAFCQESLCTEGFFFFPWSTTFPSLTKMPSLQGGGFCNQWLPAAEGFMCQWWKSAGVLSAPEDVV